MQVQVQVAVDVVQGQAGGAELLKLGVNLAPQRLAQTALEEVAEPGARRVVAEFTSGVHQPGNCVGRQGRMAAQQGQMQPHAQRRVLAGEGDGLLKGGFIHHQAGGGENAFAVGADDGLVDGGGTAEVVGVDDQAARLCIRIWPARRHNWATWRRKQIATRSAE